MLGMIKGFFFPRTNYRYHIERVTANGIEGWVYHKWRARPCHVQIFTMDRVLIGEGIADLYREDLGGRDCGFRLENVRDKILDLMPGRAMLVVDGIRLCSLYFFSPVDVSLLEKELIERHEILCGLKVARLERENEQLTRYVAHLEQGRRSAVKDGT